jgi:hypothetical protein
MKLLISNQRSVLKDQSRDGLQLDNSLTKSHTPIRIEENEKLTSHWWSHTPIRIEENEELPYIYVTEKGSTAARRKPSELLDRIIRCNINRNKIATQDLYVAIPTYGDGPTRIRIRPSPLKTSGSFPTKGVGGGRSTTPHSPPWGDLPWPPLLLQDLVFSVSKSKILCLFTFLNSPTSLWTNRYYKMT